MVLTSEELEDFQRQLVAIDKRLGKLGSGEVRDPSLISLLATSAKEWLRISQALRDIDVGMPRTLEAYDIRMQEVLKSTGLRTRASAYRKKLAAFFGPFLDDVLIPLIRHEGSPAQVAGRQIAPIFTGNTRPDEVPYVDEAARCVAARCYRAAIIMLWAAGIARLHRAIEGKGFAAFNSAAAAAATKKGNPYSRVTRGISVSSLPELQRVRDFDILVVGMELWKYDLQVFEELERLLGIRNSSAHPGMLAPTVLDVQQFATKLNGLIFAAIPV